jgi:hypothetical protein
LPAAPIGATIEWQGKQELKMPNITVQQYLDVPSDWKVKEKIKHSIVLMPNKEDIRKATPRNPRACALHNAACRMFEIPNCAIGGRWAYIPQKDERGKWYIARMQAPMSTRRAIKKFDTTGKMPEGGFEFVPIAPSHTYKSKKAYNINYSYKKIPGAAPVSTTPSGVTKKITKRRIVKKQRMAPLRALPRKLLHVG